MAKNKKTKPAKKPAAKAAKPAKAQKASKAVKSSKAPKAVSKAVKTGKVSKPQKAVAKPAAKPVVKTKAAAKPSKTTSSVKPATKSAKPVKAAKPSAPAKPVKEVQRPEPKILKAKNEVAQPAPQTNGKISPSWLAKQKDRLLALRDGMLDSMNGVAKDALRERAEGSEANAFGMHQADAGSDAYDRDFALSLLSQEQDALYEIDEALKRVDLGTYGMCEMSGKRIPQERLEAIPFARYTVECQSQIERQQKATRIRQPVTSLFGLSEDEAGDGDDEEPASTTEQKES
jgi:RNA polymerase-binding transcription factor DksA